MLRTNQEKGAASAAGGGGNRTDALIVERVFQETVEFARKNTWLLQSASWLNFWFTPPWMQLSHADVIFNSENPHHMDHLNVPPDLPDGVAIEKEAFYQITAYQYIRDYALGLDKIDTLIYSSLSTYFLPTVYALLGASW